MKFLRNLLAAIMGSLIAFGIIFMMFSIFFSLMGARDQSVAIDSDSVLELQLQGPIADYVGNNDMDPFSVVFNGSQGLDEIVHAIAVAKDDDRIKGISLNNNFIMAGMAQTQTIRKALEDFKTSGKFVYAFGDVYSQKDYYLASVADSVFLNPVGVLDFKGLSTEVLYFKDFQDKTGIKMEVVRHGKYKSAVEPYLENEMSDANRRQIKELIQSIWSSMLTDISATRNLTMTDLNSIADTLGGRLPKLAKKSGLIDQIAFYDQYENSLKKATNKQQEDEVNIIPLTNYTQYANSQRILTGSSKIAVIFAQGEILYGEGGPQTIGQGIINEALKKAREDEEVKAVVLRVDSPGGSSLTSDIIWREVALTKKEKPVVVSMGNVAASGGYYIAVGADKIYAEPTTITGSIGVFGTIPNINELATKVGINAEQVGTNANAVDYSLFEPLKDDFRNKMQEDIEDTYQIFLKRVSEGRKMPVAQVDSIAQGRVWSGSEAQKIGLVDALGTLEDAIAEAASLAGITSFSIKKWPKYKSGFERLMEDLEGASTQFKQDLIKEELGAEAFELWKEIKGREKYDGIQAKLPFTLHIK